MGGYTYFRCGAGLMNPDLASFVNDKFDPRGTDTLPDNLYCDILNKYIEVGDIGQGLTVKDLGVTNFLTDSETKCGLAAGTLSNTKTDDSTDDDDVKPEDKATTDDSTDDDDKAATDDSSDDDDKAQTDDSSDDDDKDSGVLSNFSLASVAASMLYVLFSQ